MPPSVTESPSGGVASCRLARVRVREAAPYSVDHPPFAVSRSSPVRSVPGVIRVVGHRSRTAPVSPLPVRPGDRCGREPLDAGALDRLNRHVGMFRSAPALDETRR